MTPVVSLLNSPDSSPAHPAVARTDMSVVLVCWNNKAYLGPCLESLYKGPIRTRFDVVVVDNGSTDGSQDMLRERFPDVIVLQNDSNVGLSRASNQGIRATSGRYVLLLNNDTIVNGTSMDAMVAFLDEHPRVGAVGPRVLNEDGSVQSCYNHFPTLREEFLIATRLGEICRDGYPSVVDENDVRAVGWMTSACLLLRREALDAVGLLDEEYFIYGDEVDLQYRLYKAGWPAYYTPQATIVHFGGRSLDRWRRRKMVYRGKMLFYQKNYGPFRTAALRAMLGGLSLMKLGIWAAASCLPWKRERARKELVSNIEVVKLCQRLE